MESDVSDSVMNYPSNYQRIRLTVVVKVKFIGRILAL